VKRYALVILAGLGLAFIAEGPGPSLVTADPAPAPVIHEYAVLRPAPLVRLPVEVDRARVVAAHRATRGKDRAPIRVVKKREKRVVKKTVPRKKTTTVSPLGLAAWLDSPMARKVVKRESGGDCSATSRTGKYRGKWQFDLPTYHAHGGVGDPARASCHTQDVVAYALWRDRGWQPWTTAY
jgi:hypothetical protein